jgi:hypothetical protein
MPDNGALTGALMLGQQLERYRWEDQFTSVRATNQLIADYNLLGKQHTELMQQHNKLVEGYNKLHGLALESEAERKRSASLVKELTEENRRRAAAFEMLQLDLERVTNELKLLRTRDRQQNPDFYRFSDD